MQTLSEKILNGLQRCLPETDEEGMSDCISCPYNNCCDDETEVNLPVQMVEDIRELLKEQDTQNVVDMRLSKDWFRIAQCPRCNELLQWVYHRNHCGYCGQAAKWK